MKKSPLNNLAKGLFPLFHHSIIPSFHRGGIIQNAIRITVFSKIFRNSEASVYHVFGKGYFFLFHLFYL